MARGDGLRKKINWKKVGNQPIKKMFKNKKLTAGESMKYMWLYIKKKNLSPSKKKSTDDE